MDTDPAVPDPASPEVTSTLPVPPDKDVPLDNRTAPDRKVIPDALADRITTAPVLELELDPLTMYTEPPVDVDVDPPPPAAIVIDPPAAVPLPPLMMTLPPLPAPPVPAEIVTGLPFVVDALPTLMLIGPADAPFAGPVTRSKEPELPAAVDPELRSRVPDTPPTVFDVIITILPLEDASPWPLTNRRLPPVAVLLTPP